MAVTVPSEFVAPMTVTSLPTARSEAVPVWATAMVADPGIKMILVLPSSSFTVMLPLS